MTARGKQSGDSLATAVLGVAARHPMVARRRGAQCGIVLVTVRSGEIAWQGWGGGGGGGRRDGMGCRAVDEGGELVESQDTDGRTDGRMRRTTKLKYCATLIAFLGGRTNGGGLAVADSQLARPSLC